MAKKPRSRVADYAVYLAVRLVGAVVGMLSPRVAFAACDFAARTCYRFLPRRRVALENVRAAFPELAADPDAADRLVRAMYRHYLRVIVELVLLPRKLHLHNWRKYVVTPSGLPAMLEDRCVLLIGGHFGNWELAGRLFGLFGFRTHAIARVLDNPYLERLALRFRQATGQTIIAKKDDFARLTGTMAAGGKVGLLADQDAGPRGVFVDFFGRPASTHKAIALMALEHDAVLVVGGMSRVSRADHPQPPGFDPADPMAPLFYAGCFTDLIDSRDYADHPDAVQALTIRYTAALEALIRRHPEQYLWIHRRWKHQPKARAKPVTSAA